MSDQPTKKHQGGQHRGAERSAPYPVSRLAPAVELVDLAKSISDADKTIRNHATGKLSVIARQIKSLQDEAKQILQQAQRDQKLHRAHCNCQRIVGKTYHLYRDDCGECYFSLLSPDDWQGQPPHKHEGAYRLESDMSWSALHEVTEDDSQPVLKHLLEQLDD
jgi:ribosomal protein L37E